MRITIDLQPEDIKEALEAHILVHLNLSTNVVVNELNGLFQVNVALPESDTILPLTRAPVDPSNVVKQSAVEPVKRTRRSKEQIEADRLAEASVGTDVQAKEEGFGTRTMDVPTLPQSNGTYYEVATEEPATEPSESGLMATIFAEEPEVEEVVQDIFAVEDNSVFAQPATENVFAIK